MSPFSLRSRFTFSEPLRVGCDVTLECKVMLARRVLSSVLLTVPEPESSLDLHSSGQVHRDRLLTQKNSICSCQVTVPGLRSFKSEGLGPRSVGIGYRKKAPQVSSADLVLLPLQPHPSQTAPKAALQETTLLRHSFIAPY